MRFSLLALASLTLATAALSQGTPPTPLAPAPVTDLRPDPAVRFGVLPNGMHYAIRRNATPPRNASLRLRIGAGSLHEAEDQRGLAHFLEHMVLNGTTHVPEGEFVRRLERHGLRFGADTNASTDWRQTVFKLDLPETDAGTIDEAMFLLREVVGEATLAPAAIDRERGIIQAEERTRGSTQYRLAVEELGWLMPGQRLTTRMPIGDPGVIATAGRDRLRIFYDAYYRPERATLIAVGDFDLDEMEAKIRARFSDWRGRGPAGSDPDLGKVAEGRGNVGHLAVSSTSPDRISLAWVRPPDLRPDTRARQIEKLADTLVFMILNRRLQRDAAAWSPAPFAVAQANRSQIAQSALITQIGAVTQPGQWRRALTTIVTEQRRLVDYPVSDTEVRRELTQLRAGLSTAVAGSATRGSAGLADGLVATVDANIVFMAPAEAMAIFDAARPSMTPARLQQAARALFAGEPLINQSASAPVDGGLEATIAAYRAARSAPVTAPVVQQAQAWPYGPAATPGRVAERHQLAEPIGATILRFANGVRLTVKHTDFAHDRIAVAVRFGRGRLDLPVDRPNPNFAMGAGFVSGGLGRISYEDLQDSLDSRVFSVALETEDDSFQLHGTTRPQDLGMQLQVLSAYLTDPGWRASTWNRLRSLSGMVHRQMASTAGGVFSREQDALLHNGDRRWSRPSQQEMEAMDIAAARAVLEGPLAHSPVEVIVVGDVNVEDAIRLTATTFGALPRRPEGAAMPPPSIRFPAGAADPVRFTHGGRSDQGLAFIGWPTQGFFDNQRQARALSVLAAIYRLRLIEKIREEQGTTYSPVAYHDSSEAFPGYGVFGARIEAPPAALAGFLREARQIAADLRDRPVDADEMQRARLPLVESIVRARNGNGWWIEGLARVQTDPRAITMLASQLEDYRSITAEEVQRAARAFLLPERAWSMIVAPETRTAAPAVAAPAR